MGGSEWTIRSTTAYRTVPDVPTDPPESEQRICGTCYYYDPCPCGRCGWGYCTNCDEYQYKPEDHSCTMWREA